MSFDPHVTVAVVVKNDGKFLFVEELSHGEQVINQPAGHVEENETLIEATLRETLEESGYRIEISHLIGIYVYDAPNGVTYYRMCFSGHVIEKVTDQYDDGIIGPVWLSLDELKAQEAKWRSPLVLKCVEDYINNDPLPLSCVSEFRNR